MANIIQRKYDASAAFTITLSSLTNGSARQSTLIANSTNNRLGALIYLILESGGSAPTVGTVYEVYLIRADVDGTQNVTSDAGGDTDAAITIENAPLLGTIVVTATINKLFYGVFDTAPLGPLGPAWGIAVKNATGQTMHATEGNHIKRYTTYYDEVQ